MISRDSIRNHPQQEGPGSLETCSDSSLGPTNVSPQLPCLREASFQMHPQPMFKTDIAFPRQFLAHAVQLVQSSGLAIMAGPCSGISQTLNGQTSMHTPHRLHFVES